MFFLKLKREALEELTTFQKLRGGLPKRNAFRELKNQLVDAQRLVDVDQRTIDLLGRKYGFDLRKEFFSDLRKLYVDFITNFLADNSATEGEIADVWHLKAMFGISGDEHERLFKKASMTIYKRNVKDVIYDGKITDEEKKRLNDLSDYLDISDETTKEIFKSAAYDLIEYRTEQATDDRRLSDREMNEIDEIQSNLGVSIDFTGPLQSKLGFCRRLWQIEHGELPEIDAGINLYKGEKCILKTWANWSEYRTVTTRVRYGGLAFRVKIVKGVYFKAADYAVSRKTEDQLKYVDQVEVFVTTRRLILSGEKKSTTIRLNRILDVTPDSSGVIIQKDAGRSPFLEIKGGESLHDLEIFYAALCRIIRDYG